MDKRPEIFYQNKACPHYPCHKGIPETEFNCKFCYCPLYMVKDCGGNPAWINTESGQPIKDCSGCTRPHTDSEGIIKVLKKLNSGK